MRKYIPTVLISLTTALLCLAVYHFQFRKENKQDTADQTYFVNELLENDRLNSRPYFRPPVNDKKFISVSVNVKKAVVSINATRIKDSGFFREKYSKSSGSGVLISTDGYLVTNYHVVEDASDIKVRLEDKREFTAELKGFDLATDIALLKLDGTDLPYLEFGNSDSLMVGEWVLAVGNPFKLQSSVTAGIVSAKARNINIFDRQGIESFIQTDAAINPGNSGGALVNTDGRLMGINTAIMSNSGNYEGFSFAIPSNLVKKVYKDIREYGAVQRAWLGVNIFEVDEKKAKALDLDLIGGVYLDIVEKNSSAQMAGLRSRDVIVTIDGKATLTVPVFLEILGRYRPGDKVNIEYFRNGKKHSTTATLHNQLNTTDFIAVRKDKILTDLGFELRDLNALEKDRFERDGVIVVSIYKGSTIAKTNMDPGYIITDINNEPAENVDKIIEILKRSHDEVTLKGFYENYPGEWPYRFNLN